MTALERARAAQAAVDLYSDGVVPDEDTPRDARSDAALARVWSLLRRRRARATPQPEASFDGL